ncbi:MAG: NosD domain-containing protein [Actinomycetota bacterium]|nr:NosD domain-containing protein [Actinomycetota bacterium]
MMDDVSRGKQSCKPSLRKKNRLLFRAVLIVIFVAAAVASMFVISLDTARAATYTVINTNNSGAGSLRQAIDDANANPGADTIEFDIPGSGPHVIQPTSFLPAFTDEVTVDGYSQPGSARATATTPATILIELDGSSAGASVGGLYFWYDTEGSTVSGLAIHSWNRDGIYVLGTGGVTIEGNYIGTDAGGTVAHGNTDCGVIIEQESSSGTVVGGTDPGNRNIISANTGAGVSIVLANNCTIQGNYIGTDVSGTAIMSNGGDGVDAYGDGNVVGGDAAGAGNVISANRGDGIQAQTISSGCNIAGNHIGVDATGSAELPNGGHGVNVAGYGVTVGGTTAGAGNVISSNHKQGINVDGVSGTVIKGNLLGTNAAGTAAFPNGWSGVCINSGSSHATVGGATADERNVISGNDIYGVDIQDSTHVSVLGNYIGTDAAGDTGLQNGYAGIRIWNSAEDVAVGGSGAGEGNVISGNGEHGVDMDHATNVTLEGNYIGTDAAGTSPLANFYCGINVGSDVSGVVIGGGAAGQGNVISGNRTGIHLCCSTGVQVEGNYIGTDASGTAPLGNSGDGVHLMNGSNDTIVGGSAAAGNLIADNGKEGVSIKDSKDCEVSYNRIEDNVGIGVVVWDKYSYCDRISENSIYGNGGLAIDLLGDGVTPNDGNNDNHDKPNRGYNFPVFSASQFTAVGGSATVTGTAPPNAIVELYNTGPTPDPSGHGQGQTFLDSTAADGDGDFSIVLTGLAEGDVISAIAISPAGDPSGEGNTSEFCENAGIRAGYNINASVSGGHGTVDPPSQVVLQGNDGTIDIHPDAGYHIDSITDNGTPATVANPYVISNVQEAHDVVVTFAIDTFDVDASVSGGHGGVDPASQTVDYGSGATIDIHPDAGYHIDTITDNGNPATVANPYVISNVQEAHDVVVTFAIDEQTLYFAEGYTGGGFQEYLCLAQPSDAPLQVTVTYLFSDGSDPKVERYEVPALSRFTVNVNGVVGEGREVSLKCEADSPFAAERPMYFDYTGGGSSWTGGSTVVGATSPADTWYFAEGCTGYGFDEWVCVLNPGDTMAELTFHFLTQEEGEKTVTGLDVPANSRRSFKANDLLGGVYQTSLTLESSQPVVAERPMYFDYGGTGDWGWTGGHCVIGASSLATEYYFAEGTTREGFEEWLTIQNPNAAPITVDAVYHPASGQGDEVTRSYTVEPGRRYTVFVPAEVGEGKDVSAYLSSADPFLAERPMYFNYTANGASGWTGGHCVIGSAASADGWFFAEGYTGEGFQEWLCLYNPGDSEAGVKITYYTEEEGALTPRAVDVPARSRMNVYVNDNAGENLQVSSMIEVTSGPGIVAERPMYFNYNGVWTGGHDVVGGLYDH